MLSERITALFSVLQCSNTDIARHAGCSSGNISKLKTGNRTPKPTSRSIAVFAQGVYSYADYEKMLPVLQELCGARDTTRECLIPALIAWLYETQAAQLPVQEVIPRSKRAQALRRQSFGEKLDRAMTLLELSNGQLAAMLHIDGSLVSRYRSGIYSPHGNERLSERLAGVLLACAEKKGQRAAFAELCAVGEAELDTGAVAEWLYGAPEEDGTVLAQMLLRSLDDFTPGGGLPAAVPETPPVEVSDCYWRTVGLRSAVVRFLSDAAREGGELLLYSDEPMDWMAGDRDYFALWASLMAACVSRGVKIRIIHNVDRDGQEMVNAIKGWFPLYISGMIEPYVFSRIRNARFCHTVFLHTGRACIHSFFPAGRDERWYDYLTDPVRLEMLKGQYDAMLAAASPFLKIYTAAMREEFYAFHTDRVGARNYLLTALPVVAMPEELLERILSRAAVSAEEKSEALSRYRDMRGRFFDMLRQSDVNMILCPSVEETTLPGRVNFSLDLLELSIEYTPEEYAEHIAAVMELVENEKNFHLTLLPSAPFRDTQLVTMKDTVVVTRCREPYAAFVFLNPTLTQSVSDYLAMLVEQHAADRRTTIKVLEEWRDAAAGRD